MCIPGEDVYSIVIHPHQGTHPQREWGYASLGMHVLTENSYSHRECTT